MFQLSTQDNAKLPEELKSGFRGTINWNIYQLKVSAERQNQYLDYLIDSSLQGVRTFCFIIWKWNTKNNLQTILSYDCRNKKSYVMIDGQNFFDRPVKHKLMTYGNISKFAAGEGDDCTAGCLLDYNYFKNH